MLHAMGSAAWAELYDTTPANAIIAVDKIFLFIFYSPFAVVSKPPIAFGTKGRKKDEKIREFYKNKNRRFNRWFAFDIRLYRVLSRICLCFSIQKAPAGAFFMRPF